MTATASVASSARPGDAEPVLRVRGVSKRFVQHLLGGAILTVLDGVDVDVDAGSCVVLTGPSGSGKSTLLRCVHRSCRPDEGSILLGDGDQAVDMAAADDRAVLDARRRLVAMCTQFLSVVPRVGAADLVSAEGVESARAADLLRSLGLGADHLDSPPATFSGGERQMVALALALARPRPLLLVDEATASLDPARRRVALEALTEAKRGGTAILAVFHDVPDHDGLVDDVVRLRDGRVVR